MTNGLDLMAIKPLKAEIFHGLEDIIVKGQLRAIDMRAGGQVTVIYKRIAEVRMCPYCFNKSGSFHLPVKLLGSYTSKGFVAFLKTASCWTVSQPLPVIASDQRERGNPLNFDALRDCFVVTPWRDSSQWHYDTFSSGVDSLLYPIIFFMIFQVVAWNAFWFDCHSKKG